MSIFLAYDKLPTQFQNLHLWALKKLLPLVKTWGLNVHPDLGRLHKIRNNKPAPSYQ
jgi:hypothetical protein